jgi:hypothetical protein
VPDREKANLALHSDLLISRQLPPSPMMFFAVWIEHALNAMGRMLGFRKLCDVGPSILQRDEFSDAGSGDWIVEVAVPASISHKRAANHADEDFDVLTGISGRELYRQPTRGGFSTVGTIVMIHRCGRLDRSSWTDRTMPKNLDPFKISSAARPLYWARRQRAVSRKLLVSTVCTMTSSGHACTVPVKR